MVNQSSKASGPTVLSFRFLCMPLLTVPAVLRRQSVLLLLLFLVKFSSSCNWLGLSAKEKWVNVISHQNWNMYIVYTYQLLKAFLMSHFRKIWWRNGNRNPIKYENSSLKSHSLFTRLQNNKHQAMTSNVLWKTKKQRYQL